MSVNKRASRVEEADVEAEADLGVISGRPVVLIDDVINTGRTSWFVLHSLTKHGPFPVEIAVLIERKHTQYPVKASYSGMVLHDTLDNYVSVSLEEGRMGAFLHTVKDER